MVFVCAANDYKYRSTCFRGESIAASIFGNVITGRITVCHMQILSTQLAWCKPNNGRGSCAPSTFFCDRIAKFVRHPAQFYVLAIKAVSRLWRTITSICLFVSFESEYIIELFQHYPIL